MTAVEIELAEPAANIAAVSSSCPGHCPGPADLQPIEEALDRLFETSSWDDWPDGAQRLRVRGARRILTWLQSLPGTGWQHRWATSGIDDGEDWGGRLTATDPRCVGINRDELRYGMNWLLLARVMQPGFGYFAHNRSLFVYQHAPRIIDPEVFAAIRQRSASLKVNSSSHTAAEKVLVRVALHTGKGINAISAEDLLELREWRRRHGQHDSGVGTAWDLLRGIGVLEASGSLAETVRVGQRSVSEMVDAYGICSPRVREVLIRYGQERQPSLDYTSLRGIIGDLAGIFWADIERHHPGIDTLALSDEVAEAWKQRLRTQPTRRGEPPPRTRQLEILAQVRAFYLDIQEWAHGDSYWVQWAARSPVRKGDTAGIVKARQQQIAVMHQRVRERLPQLPILVDTAIAHRDNQQTLLRAAASTPAGVVFNHHEHRYRRVVFKKPTKDPAVLVEDVETGDRINLSHAEDDAFWAWAIIETLRHTGVRIEELLELTHLALTSYQLPDTAELVPLLQVVPSKTNEERLLLVSPELASVLATIISRLRRGNGGLVPLSARYDGHERITGPALPHLFQRRHAHRWKVLSYTTVHRLLTDSVNRTGLRDAAGQVLTYTAHDFRRMFATDAVTAGLPIHIAARLLGHRTVTTTQSYLAVFQHDLIRAYRSFVDNRRATRPDTEYRDPTAEEWREFEQHFHTRKLELGDCGRPYGAGCRHEHACVRCPMLRVAPAQRDRLLEIIVNLGERIAEAKLNGWHGEAQGLAHSLTKANEKLRALDRSLADSSPGSFTDLGIPVPRTPPPTTPT
ncbi:tyrosine-type recombinase/integrase [Nocardia brasiliensis]|uniref:tyrosine-type recombinase/integrase n=1 Tax=Nocardia brasiliensis TaxID=37326 RepID=UPI002458B215|nr:site-specific integrase [Nocardia brasiliensis]